jgi:hypothetical protein
VNGWDVPGTHGLPIRGIDDLHRVLTEAKVGVVSSLTILRALEKRTLSIKPEDRTA